MSDKSLAEAAEELTPIDNLYDENARLRAELVQLRAKHGKDHAALMRLRRAAQVGQLPRWVMELVESTWSST